MTITLEIRPEVQEVLTRQTAVQGKGVGVYAASLLEEAAQAASAKVCSLVQAEDMVELFAPLRGLNPDFERDRDTERDITL